MRRRKRLPTRRRRAARCAAAALVLLILAQNFLHTAYLLPIQAVRLMEEKQGLQGSQVVRRQWEPEVYGWSSLFYLTAGGRAVSLTGVSLTARGWWPTHTGLLDCAEDKPLHAGEEIVMLDTGEDAENRYYGTHLFFYGRVDDPAIETVEIRLQVPPDYEAAEGETVDVGYYLLLNAPIFEKEGRRYFLLDHRTSFQSAARADRIVGRNAAGNGVTSFQIPVTGRSIARRAPRGAEAGGST